MIHKSPGHVLDEPRREFLLLVDGHRRIHLPRVEGLGIPKRIDTGAPATHGVPMGGRQVPWYRYVFGFRGLSEPIAGEDVVRPPCQLMDGDRFVALLELRGIQFRSPGIGLRVQESRGSGLQPSIQESRDSEASFPKGCQGDVGPFPRHHL